LESDSNRGEGVYIALNVKQVTEIDWIIGLKRRVLLVREITLY